MLMLSAWGTLLFFNSRNSPGVGTTLVPAASRKPANVSEFPLLDGRVWSLADHKGRVVLVNLWATWCPPCRAETPSLVKLAGELKSDGLDVLGVSMDQGEASPIERFVSEYKIPYPTARGIDERSFSLGIPLPTTMVYDRSGKLALTTVGTLEEGLFREQLMRLLKESRR